MPHPPLSRLVILLLLLLVACGGDEDERDPRALFSAGVNHSLDATRYFEMDQDTLGAEANRKAIEAYKKVIALDSTHPAAVSALAHALLLAEEYDQAILWYRRAIDRDSGVALHYTEMGVAEVNTGRFADARRSLDKGLAIDSSEGHRAFVTGELARIGLMAFQYGEGYASEGHMEQAAEYHRFALEVLKTAYGIGRSSALAANIADLAESLGDTVTAEAYRQGVD